MRKTFNCISLFLLFSFLSCGIAFAAPSQYRKLFREDGYDMYVDTKTIVQGKGVTSFWIKSVYSEEAKQSVRKSLPKNLKNAKIDYEMNYFQYDSKKNKFNIKMSSVYSGNKEIFRDGDKKWYPLNEGTVAKMVWQKMEEYFKAIKEEG